MEISKLITFTSNFHSRRGNRESKTEKQQPRVNGTTNSLTIEANRKAEILILKAVQQDAFDQEIRCLKKGEPLPKTSQLSS